MNEYGLSPMDLLRVMGPLLIYPIARWKLHREQSFDNQLGVKVALHYFRMLAFQLILLGATLLVWTVIMKASEKGELYRASFGFLVPGAIVFGVHSALVNRTNDAQYPSVNRLFQGYNLLVTGLLGFSALVFACQALFAKGSSGDVGRFIFAAVLIYVAAWATCGIQFGRIVLGGPGAATPPGNIVTPPPPMPPAQASGGPSLPPLSSGSAFPPIEPKS
jgi:hypothetical protein